MAAESPGISVVIPARNAAATLERTLAAVLAQDVDEAFEVIVVDDASTDETAELAERHEGVRLVRHDAPRGPGPARNSGTNAARAPLLAFTDADCYPHRDWLREGLVALAGADLVQGGVRADPGRTPEPFDRTVWVVAEVGLYETANLFVRRDWFDRVGGFEDWLGARIGKPLAEDLWLGWRLRRAGARVAFHPAAAVDHEVFRRSALEYVAERARLVYFPAIVGKVPELRSELLFARVFLNRRSARFDLAVAAAAVALATRSVLPLAGAIPYGRDLVRDSRRWGRRAPGAALAGVAADGLGLFALAAGTARTGSPVL